MGNIRQTLKFYWKYTRRYPKQVALALLVIVQVLLNVIFIPLMIGSGIGKLTDPEAVQLSYGSIFMLIILAAAIGVICNRIATNALDEFEISATKDIHIAIAEHLLNESYEFHTKSFSGALISQGGRLASSYITFIDTIFLEAIRTTIVVCISSITLAFYDVRLAAIMSGATFLGIAATTIMVRKRYPLQKVAVAKSTEHNALFADIITNAITVKTFAAEDTEMKAYRKLSERAGQLLRNAWRKQINANNVTLAMVSVMNISVLGYGIYAVQRGMLPAAIFITAQIYAVRISGAFWDTSRMIRSFERLFADAHEMVSIMQQTSSVQDKPSAGALTVTEGLLAFNNVTFSYTDATEQKVINNLNLIIKPGEKVGLVGRSGGGKSTLTKLALRFMDIQDGSIEIDGQNIADVTQASLRSHIAYVPQEPLLFHRTIAENIRYGKPDASLEEIKHVAKLAFAHDFIRELPQSYRTEVGERGIKLSGGQRQRIAIARAMLRDAPILVLDEATSALDSESEVLIQEALWELMKDRTALVIAHRLSTVQRMDRIVVVDNGKIIEHGSHKNLLKKKGGVYAELWRHQSGGFLED